jgi:hypothetical protein
MEPRDRADQALLMLYLAPAAEHVAVLQAMQQLVQRELARLWSGGGQSGAHTERHEGGITPCANETS